MVPVCATANPGLGCWHADFIFHSVLPYESGTGEPAPYNGGGAGTPGVAVLCASLGLVAKFILFLGPLKLLVLSIQRLLEASKPLFLSIQRLLEASKPLFLPSERFLEAHKPPFLTSERLLVASKPLFSLIQPLPGASKFKFLSIRTFLASSSMSHARSKSISKRLRASGNHSKARSLGKHRGALRKPPQASG